MRGSIWWVWCGAVLLAFQGVAAELPDASWEKLPRWRGFNLLDKYSVQWKTGPFEESDFALISKWGFNFVRLPMDYHAWIVDNDPERFDEAALKEIDQAVAWGRKYAVHVCLCFHRAPGYCVNPPAEKLNLWKDPEALRLCALHWRTFARRYKGVPNRNLSFNLFNEPNHQDVESYLRVVRTLAEAIRAEDPDRLIIADGLRWGRNPCPALKDLKVAQATRGYDPMPISHYRASWIDGSDRWAKPSWPLTSAPGYLYGPGQGKLAAPLVVEGPFPANSRLRIRVGTVSMRSHLVVKADDAVVLDRVFVPGPGEGEWKKAVWKDEYKVYQNVYDLDVAVDLPKGATKLELSNGEGDWMSWSELGLTADGREAVLGATEEWGARPQRVQFVRDRDRWTWKTGQTRDAAWLRQDVMAPWRAPQMAGIGIMVGEWGAHNQTPHDVALAWMEDCLRNWKDAGWGWALWNLKGSFGVLDSERADVQYEIMDGHKLDRRMLELLQRY